MVEGRLRKFYEEVVLLEQIYVIDGETKVSKVLEAAAKDAGAPVTIAGFARIQLGEGVEREEQDFAAEVAATLGGCPSVLRSEAHTSELQSLMRTTYAVFSLKKKQNTVLPYRHNITPHK